MPQNLSDPNVFTSNIIESKYYDLYKTNDMSTACDNETCYGHALLETKNWYDDNAGNLNSSAHDIIGEMILV